MREHVLTLFRKNGVNGVGCNQASIERLSEILILFRFGFTAKDLEGEIESHCGCMVSRTQRSRRIQIAFGQGGFEQLAYSYSLKM